MEKKGEIRYFLDRDIFRFWFFLVVGFKDLYYGPNISVFKVEIKPENG